MISQTKADRLIHELQAAAILAGGSSQGALELEKMPLRDVLCHLEKNGIVLKLDSARFASYLLECAENR